jgi:hypothetical protein
VKPGFHNKYYSDFTTGELSVDAREEIRTSDPQIRRLHQGIDIIVVGAKYRPRNLAVPEISATQRRATRNKY